MAFSLLRCKGGFLLHVVRPNGRALCGHEPMQRDGWDAVADKAVRDCKRCIAQHAKIKAANAARGFG